MFSRLELTNLYGRLHSHLINEYEIIHLAYSTKEETILKERYGIVEIINFKCEVQKILNDETENNELLKEIDFLFIHQSKGRFSLNSAIRFDRSFQHRNYSECLLLSQVYYKFWTGFFDKQKIHFLFHEPPAVFMTHVASNICRKMGVFYLSQSQVTGLHDYDWVFIEGDFGHPFEWNYLDNLTIDNQKKAETKKFINDFRNNYDTLFSNLNTNKSSKIGHIRFFYISIALIIKHLINRYFVINKKSKNSLIDHYETFQDNLQQPLLRKLNNLWYKTHRLRYDPFDPNELFYYYPLHAEPEAAVLYRGDGIYEGQVKLIENIAEQLPPGIRLYVKDHPHRSAFADMIYLERLKRIPNLRLIDPSTSGKSITFHSKGVFTISGTTGFEAVLLNKPVFLFGQAFYMASNRVIKINNIRDLREKLYEIDQLVFIDDDQLTSFVYKFLRIAHRGFIAYFPNHVKKVKIDHDTNCKLVASEILKVMQRISEKS